MELERGRGDSGLRGGQGGQGMKGDIKHCGNRGHETQGIQGHKRKKGDTLPLLYTIGPLTEVNIFLILKNEHIKVNIFFLITN